MFRAFYWLNWRKEDEVRFEGFCAFPSSDLSSIVSIFINDHWKEQKGPDSPSALSDWILNFYNRFFSISDTSSQPHITSIQRPIPSTKLLFGICFCQLPHTLPPLFSRFRVNKRSTLWFPCIKDGPSYCENVSNKYALTSGRGKVSTKLANTSDSFYDSSRCFHRMPLNKSHEHS